MYTSGFSTSEALRMSWELWKKNWVLLGLGFLILSAIPMIPVILANFLSDDALFSQFVLHLIYYILLIFVEIGFIDLTLKIARGQEGSLGDFFSKANIFTSFLAGSILYYLVVGVGILLLIIPGLYFAVKYSLWQFLVVDKSMGGFEALKESGKLTQGSKWDVALFFIAAFFINVLGFLLLAIGLFITVPITAVAWAWVYLKLSGQEMKQVEIESTNPRKESV